MPNSNYESGRRFEYARMKHYREKGCHVMRTAGSHGLFDLICIDTRGLVIMVQCKVVSTLAQAIRLLKNFRMNPPIINADFTQVMEVKVRDTGKVESTWL